MLPWSSLNANYHITVKELIPIVIAGAIWGPLWRGTTVLAECDNIAIVNHGTSKNQDAMPLARCLAFISAKFDFHIAVTHIKGAHNIQADALSRDNLLLFRSLYLQANQTGASVPARPTVSVQTRLGMQALDRAVEHYTFGAA